MYMVHRQIGCRDELLQNYLYLGDIVHEGERTCIGNRFSSSLILHISHANGHTVSTIFLTNFVSINGLQYRLDCVVVISYAFDDVPSFGIVRLIFIDDNGKYFTVEEANSELDSHILYHH